MSGVLDRDPQRVDRDPLGAAAHSAELTGRRIGGLAPAPHPIGVSVPRRDGPAKVTGSARFTSDLDVAGMCHARILRSPHAYARILSIDATEARRAPGVVAVVTAADMGDVELRYGHNVADHPLIADGVVRFAGEPVVGIVAEDALSAECALELVSVEYEPLPAIMDPVAALAPGAPFLHSSRVLGGEEGGSVEDLAEAHPNICSASEHQWGDVDAAFAKAAFTIENEYRYPMAYAYAMEPYVAVARWHEGELTVWSSAQHPFMVRSDLARVFRLPLSAVSVSVPYVGGGYGSKSYTKIEPLVAALALRAGRPVRLALSVEESILTTRSVSAVMRVRSAFDADGLILAREADIVMNGGAYAENSPRVANKASRRLAGPYRVPAARIHARTVYTNAAPGSSYRGLGGPQATFAGESQMDEAAHRLGLDPLELRRRNLLAKGDVPWPRARPFDADLRADIEIVAAELDSTGPCAPGHGRAVSCAASDAGAEPTSSAVIRLLWDGSVVLMCGSVEMGQGSATVLPQIAAAALGIPMDRIRLIQSDTGIVSYDRSTGASRSTTVMGLAIQRAAASIRSQLREWAASVLAAERAAAGATTTTNGESATLEAGITFEDAPGGLRVGERLLSWDEIVRGWFGGSSGEVIGVGYVRRAGVTAQVPLFWEVGCLGVEVAVDEETGEVRVERLVTLGDVGRAINPMMAEGQDLGGAMMGMGIALREELVYQGEHLVNGNLFEYRVPRPTDLPAHSSFLAERGDGIGPWGAKGGGEATVNPIAPAIVNAIEQAVGVRLREVPATPERVWRALRARRDASTPT